MAERMPCGHYPTDDGTCDDPYCRKPMAGQKSSVRCCESARSGLYEA